MASEHFGKAKGYEYYEQMAKNLKGNVTGGASIEVFPEGARRLGHARDVLQQD